MAGYTILPDPLHRARLIAAALVFLSSGTAVQSPARAADELNGCSPGERAAIEALCNAERGAIAQGMCRSNQITGLLRVARKPDLSVASPVQRSAILEACSAKPLIGEQFACERSRLASTGLPVRDEPGGGALRTGTAAIGTPAIGTPRFASSGPAAGFPYFNLEKWRQQRPPIPAEYSGPTLPPERLFRRVSASVYIVVAADSSVALASGGPRAQGGAVAITSSILLTNCHILVGRPQITIAQQGETARATLIYADQGGDRCFLRTDMTLRPVPGVRRFDDLLVGEPVYSIGAPSGLELSFGNGVISGLRDLEGVRYVQNSALSWYGSSGGGLFDAKGNLVGITTAMNSAVPNQNFAIAAEDYWP
jgi:hypothetical protein